MPSGSKPGERRGGRKKGSLNHVTMDVKALALVHAPAAFAELARLATHAANEQTRVAAIKELLDRGFGRPPQSVTAEHTGELTIRWLTDSE